MRERTKPWTDRVNKLVEQNGWTIGDAALHFNVGIATMNSWIKGHRHRPPSMKFLRQLITLEEAYGKPKAFVTGVWERGRFRPIGDRKQNSQTVDEAMGADPQVRN